MYTVMYFYGEKSGFYVVYFGDVKMPMIGPFRSSVAANECAKKLGAMERPSATEVKVDDTMKAGLPGGPPMFGQSAALANKRADMQLLNTSEVKMAKPDEAEVYTIVYEYYDGVDFNSMWGGWAIYKNGERITGGCSTHKKACLELATLVHRKKQGWVP